MYYEIRVILNNQPVFTTALIEDKKESIKVGTLLSSSLPKEYSVICVECKVNEKIVSLIKPVTKGKINKVITPIIRSDTFSEDPPWN